MKILFLGANGLDTSRLRISVELRDVQAELERAKDRKDIDIRAELAVRPVDLSRILLDYRPDVVHFSGHGTLLRVRPESKRPTREFEPPEDLATANDTGQSAVLLENDDGNATAVPPEALTGLFAILKTQRCVVLNACFSSAQAQAVSKHVDCVIGMKRAIGDESAIVFSVGFYQALVRGATVKEAFELGKSLIAICNLPDSDVPELHAREGVDPADLRLGRLTDEPKKPEASATEKTTLEEAKPREGRRKRVRVAVAAVAIVVTALIVWLVAPVRLPVFLPASGTVVVVGPGILSPRGQRAAKLLAESLDLDRNRRDPEPPAVFRSRGLVGDGDDVLREKAITSQASVAIIVDSSGVGRIYPLGSLAGNDRLTRGLPAVDLSRNGAPDALAPLLRELARVVEDRLVDEKRLRCDESVADDALGVAILTMVLRLKVPNCASVKGDEEKLARRCRNDECVLLPARERSDEGGDKSDIWKEFNDRRDRGLQACEKRDTEGAFRIIEQFEAAGKAHHETVASEIAACLLASGSALSDEQTNKLRATARTTNAQCNDEACGGWLELRAWYWAKMGDWKAAEDDYAQAWSRQNNDERLLGVVDSRLHRFKEIESGELVRKTAEDLGRLSGADAKRNIRAAFLKWVAAKREGIKTYVDASEQSLIQVYGDLPDKESVYPDRDEAERGLVCPRSAKECLVYDLMSVPKSAGSAEKLRDALQKAVLPNE